MRNENYIEKIESVGKENGVDKYSVHVAVEFFKSMDVMGVDNALDEALIMVGGQDDKQQKTA